MIRSRKGVIGLPVKLTVSFLIIALMVPPMISAADEIRRDVSETEVMAVAEDLAKRISEVSSRGIGYRTHADITVPDGCRLILGGDDPTGLRVFDGDRRMGRLILAYPVFGNELVLSGPVLLELGNDPGGESVTVKEI